ncbi:hypothetical protein ACTMSW_29385 [Micromonospora sp. BQ11]|uniref:hypothetical protein n=1 Tax=Micromonospora sp. BQ11 TaxID=3452212 RepID=UPI003F88EBC7
MGEADEGGVVEFAFGSFPVVVLTEETQQGDFFLEELGRKNLGALPLSPGMG